MKRRQRLNQERQFQALYRDGIRLDSGSFRIIYRRNRLNYSRLATVVGKKFGTAVLRNQAKRRGRDLFDLFQREIYPACDILIFPNKKILTSCYPVLVLELERALEEGCLSKGPS